MDALEQEKKAKEEEGRKAAEEMKAELAAAAAEAKPKVSSIINYDAPQHPRTVNMPQSSLSWALIPR